MISRRRYAVFGLVARLPASTLASQPLWLQVNSSLNRFPAVPTRSAVLVVRVVGGWITCVHSTADLWRSAVTSERLFWSDAMIHADCMR